MAWYANPAVGTTIETGEVTDLAVTTGKIANAAVTAAKLGFAADSTVVVQRGANDAANGVNLLAAYAAAKLLTPGGNALTATNRAAVLIPPGRYSLATTGAIASLTKFAGTEHELTFTAKWAIPYVATDHVGTAGNSIRVSIIATGGGAISSTVTDDTLVINMGLTTRTFGDFRTYWTGLSSSSDQKKLVAITLANGEDEDTADTFCFAETPLAGGEDPTDGLTLDADFVDLVGLSGGNPATVQVTSTGAKGKGSTVCQMADDVRLSGFTIDNAVAAISGTASWDTHTFVIGKYETPTTNNAASKYKDMRFTQANAVYLNTNYLHVCMFARVNLAGTWDHCSCDTIGWRWGTDVALLATFYDCTTGDRSWSGDIYGSSPANNYFAGKLYRCTGGDYCFGSCTGYGNDFASGAVLEDCVGGANAFAMGKAIKSGAVLRRCRGGNNSFGGWAGSGTNYGTIDAGAILEDCVATGGYSFGAGMSGTSGCAGALRRCEVRALSDAIQLTGAVLEDCKIKTTGTDKHALVLLDSNSRILGGVLVANGTGNSIYAGSALNVVAAGIKANLDKHANVTNAIGDGTLAAGGCIVDADITL